MSPKKPSRKAVARAVPPRPRAPKFDPEAGTSERERGDDTSDDDDAVDVEDERDVETDMAATLAAKRKAQPRDMPLPPPSPQRVAREGEEDELPDEVLEFVRAIDAYKRAKGRQFPSWSEVLDVLKQLGYERRAG